MSVAHCGTLAQLTAGRRTSKPCDMHHAPCTTQQPLVIHMHQHSYSAARHIESTPSRRACTIQQLTPWHAHLAKRRTSLTPASWHMFHHLALS
eukprot:707918-Pelagomonas_calceolata.AAC.1